MTHGLTFYTPTGTDTLLSLQVHQKRPGCPTCDNTFLGLHDYTFPFIFTREASANAVTTFEIKDDEDNLIQTLDNELISIINAGDVDYISCNFQALPDSLECGHYYYEINCDTEVYYSELFRVVSGNIEYKSEDIAVNGQFTTDLSDWTVNGATWISSGGGRAQLTFGNTIAQVAPGESMVKVVVTVLNTFSSGMEFQFGNYVYNIETGINNFYVPSGVTYTIRNNDSVNGDDLTVDTVQIYEAWKLECYNLVIARNSCNKNGIPYTHTGYQDVYLIDAELYEPEYPRNDDDEEDGSKNKSITFMRIDKRWTMQTSNLNGVFEPLVDELNKLPANDCIYIFNDSWKKEFKVYEGSMDIEIQTDWQFSDKCNAIPKIIITENLALINSCCETISDIECCEEFGWDLTEGDPEQWTLTLAEPFCGNGVIYSLLVLNGDGEVVSETVFEDSIEFDSSIAVDETYSVKGSKFGCPDIIYELNVS
jgi:hypothetical protein